MPGYGVTLTLESSWPYPVAMALAETLPWIETSCPPASVSYNKILHLMCLLDYINMMAWQWKCSASCLFWVKVWITTCTGWNDKRKNNWTMGVHTVISFYVHVYFITINCTTLFFMQTQNTCRQNMKLQKQHSSMQLTINAPRRRTEKELKEPWNSYSLLMHIICSRKMTLAWLLSCQHTV